MDKKYLKSTVAVLSLAAVFGTTTGCERVSEREVGVRVDYNGRVTEEFKQGSGLEFYVPPFSNIYTYNTFMERVRIEANEANLRTSDQQPTTGAIIVQYQVDPNVGKTGVLYTTFRNDYEHYVKDQAVASAVTVFGRKSSTELTPKIDEIVKEIEQVLQAKLKEDDVPVKIHSVISAGVGLSSSADKKLEGLMVQQQYTAELKLRSDNAAKAAEVIRKEAAVITGAVDEYRKAGIPLEQIPTMICLQMADKKGGVNEEFTPGCFGGGNRTGAVINKTTVKAAPQPQ